MPRGLAGHGVAGQRVGLVGPNSVEFVVAYLAVLRAGLVAVPVDPDLPAAERNAMLRQLRASPSCWRPRAWWTSTVPGCHSPPPGLSTLAAAGERTGHLAPAIPRR